MTVETVSVNSEAPAVDDAAAQNAALQAAADGGVTVNGEPVEAPAAAPAPTTERPATVPEKFWDAEKGEVRVDAVLASNAELEKQFTKEKQGEKKDDPAPDAPKGDTPEQTNAISEAQAAWEETGQLEESHYEALEKSGLSKDVVDAYIEGQKAIQNNVMQHAYSLTEGEENFQAMTEWASTNLSEDELKSFNTQVVNPETSDYAIAQLYAKFAQVRPMETPLINGDNVNAASGEYFKSAAEMQEAMSSKQYRNDAAFRAEVEQKIARADAAGVNLFV